MMVKSYVIVISISMFSFISGSMVLRSQSIPLSLMSTASSEQTVGDVTIQYSIGEIMVTYNNLNDVLSVDEGFHQLLLRDRDLKKEAQVRASLYPNPFFNIVTLEVDNPGLLSYTVTNALGQVLSIGEFQTKIQLDVSHFVSGVYFLTIYTDARFEKSFTLLKV